MRRTGHRLAFESGLQLLCLFFQKLAVWNYFALRRCPGADLASPGPHPEVFARFRVGSFFDFPFDTHLPFKLFPKESERYMWISFDLMSLFAVIIGEEGKASFIEVFQQHDTARWAAFEHSTEQHRICF
ncbi:hypothetical protein D3C87_1851130 [compost metagenome]